MTLFRKHKLLILAVIIFLVTLIGLECASLISKESKRRWLKECVNWQGDISDADLAEKCYSRSVETGQLGVFGGKTSLEWLL